MLTFYRETLGSSLNLGIDVLRALGFRAHQAHRAAQLFKEHDEKSVRDPAQFLENDDVYFNEARRHIEAFDRMFASDATGHRSESDRGWEPLPPGNASRG